MSSKYINAIDGCETRKSDEMTKSKGLEDESLPNSPKFYRPKGEVAKKDEEMK